jgi:2-polyprenyl-3-methyl-5-hydroxy-6-metoxy-1,4-benzoquinol methylase
MRRSVWHPRDGARRAGLDARHSAGWLPQDMRGLRLLDAGCGTGALAVEAARRGAEVLAIDVSALCSSMWRATAPPEVGLAPASTWATCSTRASAPSTTSSRWTA